MIEPLHKLHSLSKDEFASRCIIANELVMKSLLCTQMKRQKKCFKLHKKVEKRLHPQVHYYWWSQKHHQSQWPLQDTIYFLVSFCLSPLACHAFCFSSCGIISGMLSQAWDPLALSPSMDSMVTPRKTSFLVFCHCQPIASSLCALALTASIITAWHDSGPDLQSAPTPWMLDASLPFGGSRFAFGLHRPLGSWCPPGL